MGCFFPIFLPASLDIAQAVAGDPPGLTATEQATVWNMPQLTNMNLNAVANTGRIGFCPGRNNALQMKMRS